MPLDDKSAAEFTFNLEALFPHDIALSDGIERDEWLRSMLVQPDLFIRLRKDKKKAEALLAQQELPYSISSGNCVALPNGAKIESILPADSYVVQDASSQATGDYFKPKKNEEWWDCCCGAGGKSLLLKDAEPTVRLTVSDRRESILHNLKQRFKLYGHTLPVSLVMDIADSAAVSSALGNRQFDNILCDVPCSGSGTWARTPEQLYFFDPLKVEHYSSLQAAIATNAAVHLKPGGRLIYITCSVFRQENEEVINTVIRNAGLQVNTLQLINGVGIKADSMFISVLQKANA
jgi:16S rRNA (cytosine967-C5)-methyltransferase